MTTGEDFVLSDPTAVTEFGDKPGSVEKSHRARNGCIEDDRILGFAVEQKGDHAVIAGVSSIKLAVIATYAKCCLGHFLLTLSRIGLLR